MIVNRLIERARSLRLDRRLLARRARASARERPPVVIVPPCMGVKLADDRGRSVWGAPLDALLGIPRLGVSRATVGVPLEGFELVPGVWSYDVLGGLVRFLGEVGGYRRDEELFVLRYDWRLGVRHGAAELAALVDRIRGVGDTVVDVVTISSGGPIARAYAARGTDAARTIRRVVHLGAPQRGTFSAFESLQRGVQLVDRARFVPAARLAATQTTFDSLPHPDDPIFVDETGAAIARDLYDATTWKELRLAGADREDLADRLAEARAMHRLVDAAPAQVDTWAIAARHLRTAARAMIVHDRVILPDCCAPATDPRQALLHTTGDGSIPEASLRATIDPERIWWLPARRGPAQHRLIVSDPTAHALALEALLAPSRPVPRDLYSLRRDHRPPSRTTVAPFM